MNVGLSFKISVLCLLLLQGLAGWAQPKVNDNEEFLFNSARDFLSFQDYESAYDLFAELDSIAPNNKVYTYNIGLCLFNSLDKVKSLFYFLKARQLGYEENEINYYLGLAYRFNYDLDNASYYLHEFIRQQKDTDENYETKRTDALHLIDQVESSKQLLNQKLSIGILNMGPEINSEDADYVPIVLSKDSLILFTSRRRGSTGGKISIDGTHYEDIYISKMNKDGQWGKAIHFPEFNSKHHDANVAINKDQNELYVFKARRHGDIYVSRKRNNGQWISGKPLKGINSKYWEGSICLSPKEDTLYFSSDRPGGYGGSDLYRAVRDSKGNWTNIQNLGATINTPFDEDAPYMYKDGKTFFFSSRGHNSMGGYDVFSAKLIHGEWTDVKNIGFPINTVDDDIYFQLNSEASFGYFTSFRHSNFRERSIGEKDLFEITRPNSSPVYFVFKGVVYDERTKETIPAIVRLKDLVDTTQADQKLVADVNSGRFRYEMKFDNRYRLTVEVGDKVYFSRELYFPYQPDLFESFLDIPLKDVPSFNVKLADVLAQEKETIDNVVLDEVKNPVVVLSRTIEYDDPELKEILLSKRIPMSFRSRLMNQLKDTPYMDTSVEGEVKDLFNEAQAMDSIYRSNDGLLKKLSTDDNNKIERFELKNILKESSENDSVVVNNLSPLEQRMIQRLSDYASGVDTTVHSIDELYLKDLKTEEADRIFKIVGHQIRKKVDSDSVDKAIDRLSNLLIERRKSVSIKGFSKDAWGILYTIEASRFKFQEYERLGFKGKLTYRFNGNVAPGTILILTDDRGMIYSQGVTNADGEIRFTDLVPGRSYHILVNDYLITLLGRSRYELNEMSLLSLDEDYLKFYRSLTPEQRRSVDRIVADRLLKDHYQSNELHQWEDQEVYTKTGDPDKKFIQQLSRYLSSTSAQDSSFYLNEDIAYAYQQMTSEKRELFNRLISRQISIRKEDLVFYEKLNETQKKFIDMITNSRKAKKIITEDFLISKKDTDFWYVIDEIDTHIKGNSKEVGVSGRLLEMDKGRSGFQISLVDELNQFIGVCRTSEQGEFIFPSVPANKKFKVLISNGKNISRISDYKIVDLKIEEAGENFYQSLNANEKRIIDRIIATNLANEQYKGDTLLMKKDDKYYNSLSPEQKAFIQRLRKHLFADSVGQENMRLKKEDNHHYYAGLTWEERNFVNRFIVHAQYGMVSTSPFPLKEKDKIFYEKLTERQKLFIKNMQRQRKANADIFAENPELIVEKVWVLLDSINSTSKRSSADYFTLTGQLIDKITKLPAPNIPVMISDYQNNMIAMISTDSTGHFNVDNLSTMSNYYILAENRRVFTGDKYRYELSNINLRYFKNKTAQSDSVIIRQRQVNRLVIHFDFDSYQINTDAHEALKAWISNKENQIHTQLVIEGHTDEVGKEEYNQVLGEKRARAVKGFLIKNGFRPELLTTKSFGERKPYQHGKSDRLNRRVEIFVNQ